nr:hypothetical protein [Nitrospirota bacterium]
MAKLIGNYNIPGQPAEPEAEAAVKKEDTVSEFERKAMARLGGSIAFVMKGKNVVWNGAAPKDGADPS